LNNQCQEGREGDQDHKVKICVSIVRRKGIGLMSVEQRELIEDQEAEVAVDAPTTIENTLAQDPLKEEVTEKEVDPRMTVEAETSKKVDASVVEREVTLREIVLRAEVVAVATVVAVEDQDPHLNTETREVTTEEESQDPTHQLVAEELSMRREEEAQVAEVLVAERVTLQEEILREAPAVNLLNNLELINQVNNIISQ